MNSPGLTAEADTFGTVQTRRTAVGCADRLRRGSVIVAQAFGQQNIICYPDRCCCRRTGFGLLRGLRQKALL
jgi:hypothetical protein